jgi:lipoprotein-anchoring transpeptidase ErfK/SrfK
MRVPADNILVMPRRALTILIGFWAVSACSGGVAVEPPAVDEISIPTSTASTQEVTTTTVDPRPVWDGYAATTAETPTLGAYAHGPLDVYAAPGDAETFMTVEETTILGTATVLGVVASPEDGWVEVMLPVRPNGTTGWVSTDDVSLYVVDSEIVVDLANRQLTYIVDGVEVLVTDVGIGSEHNRTPTGRYFVTDNVTMADPNSPWGPHALGISARSDTITEFNGGDGIIGIHGTNNPDSIGGNISLGCVRLPNDAITLLHEMVPLGTRVTVRA